MDQLASLASLPRRVLSIYAQALLTALGLAESLSLTLVGGVLGAGQVLASPCLGQRAGARIRTYREV